MEFSTDLENVNVTNSQISTTCLRWRNNHGSQPLCSQDHQHIEMVHHQPLYDIQDFSIRPRGIVVVIKSRYQDPSYYALIVEHKVKPASERKRTNRNSERLDDNGEWKQNCQHISSRNKDQNNVKHRLVHFVQTLIYFQVRAGLDRLVMLMVQQYSQSKEG